MDLANIKRIEFISLFGSLYENSSFIAEEIYNNGIPEHYSAPEILLSMKNFVDQMKSEEKLQLILEHPELGLQKKETLDITEHSKEEQEGAGLNTLDRQDFNKLQSLNHRYKKKFQFPFIIAVTGLKKEDIFKNIELRLESSVALEFETAIGEIHKIAKIRLEKLI